MRIPLLVIVGLSLATATHAETKYTRKQNVAIDVKVSDRVRPIQPKVSAGKPLTGTDVMVIEERKVNLRVEQERILEELVKATPDSADDKADLLFRLAEHYMKSERFWRLKSVQTSQSKRPPLGSHQNQP